MDDEKVKDKKDEEEPVYGMQKAGRDFLSSGDYGLDESVAWNVAMTETGRLSVAFLIRAGKETATVTNTWSQFDMKSVTRVVSTESEKLDTIIRHCMQTKAALKESLAEAQRIFDERYLEGN